MAHLIDTAAILAKYQRAPGDTGSPEVQVALLTGRINHLTEHFKNVIVIRLVVNFFLMNILIYFNI